MDMFYTNETLYVNMYESITEPAVLKMQRRLFKVVEDYEIDNIVLNIQADRNYDNKIMDNFLDEYNKNHHGNLKII